MYTHRYAGYQRVAMRLRWKTWVTSPHHILALLWSPPSFRTDPYMYIYVVISEKKQVRSKNQSCNHTCGWLYSFQVLVPKRAKEQVGYSKNGEPGGATYWEFPNQSVKSIILSFKIATSQGVSLRGAPVGCPQPESFKFIQGGAP